MGSQILRGGGDIYPDTGGNIVEAHGGAVRAFPSPHGGLGIRLEFPLLASS